MSAAEEARGQRWFGRRMLSTSTLDAWSAEEWCEWFADGLEIWFSEFPNADRALAFAPLRIIPDRDHAAQALATYLGRFYEKEPTKRVKPALDMVSTIEEGAALCLRRGVIVQDCVRADFLLEVFEILEARSLPRLARLSLQVLPSRAFDAPVSDEYLSRLTYIIFDNNAVRDGDALTGILEAKLRRCENFRPALFYSLQLTDHDVLLSLIRFYELTSDIPEMDSQEVWQEVSEEFDQRFGREIVVREIGRASGASAMEDMADVGAMVPAAHLRGAYPEIRAGGILGVAEDDDDALNEAAYFQREIEVEPA